MHHKLTLDRHGFFGPGYQAAGQGERGTGTALGSGYLAVAADADTELGYYIHRDTSSASHSFRDSQFQRYRRSVKISRFFGKVALQ